MKKIILTIAISFAIILSSHAQAPQLWGIMEQGGAQSYGCIIKADSTGTNFQIDYSFDYVNGAMPVGNLCGGGNGKMYGVTYLGGYGDSCCVYEYDSLTRICHNIHDLFFDIDSGWDAWSGMIRAADGMLYGLCAMGGHYGGGVLYRINPVTNAYSPLYHFSQITGSFALGGLIQLPDGKLYGMTSQGGAFGGGVIFSYNPVDSGYVKLYDFAANQNPMYGSLLHATDGKLYGMTQQGGNNNLGVLFSFDVVTENYAELFSFNTMSGSTPYASLIQADNGMLYGMTMNGGANNYGTIFKFNTANNAFSVLHDFDIATGGNPQRSLSQASNGKLYGMTSTGGLYNGGVAFSYDIVTNTYIDLVDFGGAGLSCSGPSSDIQEMQARATANTSNVSSLNENLISAYPNPAVDVVTLSRIILNSTSQVTITDIQGREISGINHKGNVFNISSLAAGIYTVKVLSGKNVMQGKFVKN